MAKQEAQIRGTPANPVAHTDADGAPLNGADPAPESTSRVDSRLIAQIGQRDEQALGALYDRYGALVYTTALRIAQDRALAETIVQDVFHAVWQSANSFQIGASVQVWLLDMARQRAISASHPHGSGTRTRVGTHKKPYPTHRGEQAAASAEALNVRRALDGLPAAQREMVELAYYDRLSCQEIATRLHQPVSLVKAQLRVGLSTLYEQLRTAARLTR